MTHQASISIDRAISSAVFKQIRYQIRYYFPTVKDVKYETETTSLIIESTEALNEPDIEALTKRLLSQLSFVNKAFKTDTVLFQSTHQAKRGDSTHLKQFESDLVTSSRGSCLHRGRTAALISSIDSMLKSICLSLSDEEVRIPSTINIQLLNEYDYIPTFHHHISFVSHLIPNIDTIENFPAFWTSRGEERFPNGLPNQLHHPECILNPAVCLHIYPLFRNDKLPTNCLRTVTAVGKVFRNESGNHSLFDRLFEFSMREIVSFGDNITISTQAERLILLLKSLGDALELDFRLITASDMFIGKNNQARIFSQLSTQAKIEMEVHIPHTQEHLACASLNRHADHFSKPMNIKVENSNNLGETLCLGFGIERLAYALVAQHGSLAGEIVKSVDVKTLVSSLNPSGGAR